MNRGSGVLRLSDERSRKTLLAIKVLVFAANSGVFRKGISLGKANVSQVPQGTFIPFEDARHILFHKRPKKFNAALSGFVKAL